MEKSSSDPGLRNSESLESCAIPNSTSINRSDEIEDLTVSNSNQGINNSELCIRSSPGLQVRGSLLYSQDESTAPNHAMYLCMHASTFFNHAPGLYSFLF